MGNIVIKAENLSKQYRLGEVGTGTLSHDLNRFWHRIRGKEDPYLKIGEANDRTKKGDSDFVWALRDVNFEIEQGDVVGIIGRNGAGKSTLLKILSKTTLPTTGSIKAKGRIASLLEVGTGFHPELTGRDNIFLNGAILGMTKKEIKRKFDEIVDFAGVERYIDTPVKRYSSGMYVRLAFGVAAHLESEILVVDEVLAVGDAEFQKKAIGKMQDVSKGEGRTVLFVSHNMGAVQSLCTRGIVFKNGNVVFEGEISDSVITYLAQNEASAGVYIKEKENLNPEITRVEVVTSEVNNTQTNNRELSVLVDVNMPHEVSGMNISLQIFDENETATIYAYVFDNNQPILRKTGEQRYKCTISNCKLYHGKYYLRVHLAESKGKTKFETLDKICSFNVVMGDNLIEWGWPKGVCKYTENFTWEEVKSDV